MTRFTDGLNTSYKTKKQVNITLGLVASFNQRLIVENVEEQQLTEQITALTWAQSKLNLSVL